MARTPHDEECASARHPPHARAPRPGIRAPLAACRRHAADTATGKRLRGVQTYLLTTWHAFPLVWLLDNSGALGASLTRDAYLASDVAAKLLPISLYLAVASR